MDTTYEFRPALNLKPGDRYAAFGPEWRVLPRLWARLTRRPAPRRLVIYRVFAVTECGGWIAHPEK